MRHKRYKRKLDGTSKISIQMSFNNHIFGELRKIITSKDSIARDEEILKGNS